MNKNRETPLHMALAEAHVEVAALLLDKGANLNVKNTSEQSALHLAAKRGHAKIAILLLERRAEVNLGNLSVIGTPLHWAAGEGHAEIVKILIDHGADVDGRCCNVVRSGTPVRFYRRQLGANPNPRAIFIT